MSQNSSANDDLLPISLVAHHVFCPRRAWLEAVGERTDSRQVAIGDRDHAASDSPSASRPDSLRAVEVRSETLGVVGRCDTVEKSPDGFLTVVEHKSTPVRKRPELTDPMRVQVALQALALQDMGRRIAGSAIHFSSHNVRVPVPLTDDLLGFAVASVDATRAVVTSSTAPPPLEDDPRCGGCSHVGVCLPDERRLATVARRIRVADPDSQIVHLTTPGSRASIRSGRLLVTHRKEEVASLPIERVQGLVVHGNVDVSSALLREMLWQDLTVVWCSSSGRVVGWARSGSSPNGHVRPPQHAASFNGRLDLAREFVAAKVANQATQLRRGLGNSSVVTSLRSSARAASRAPSVPDLFGVEGEAAARYFENFTGLVKNQASPFVTRFPKRSRRPATDPLNAALNYAYGLLTADLVRAVISCGLDPHAGFLHSSGRNKPALALDLAEEFRAPVAESAVLRAINNGELRPTDFSEGLGSVRLRESGRKALTAAYEARVTSTFTHPLFGYEVSWRRAMEVQARLVLGVLDGTQPRYAGIRTR